MRTLGSSDEVAEAAAVAAWKHAAGEGLRDHAVATGLNGDTLIVEVPDAIWQKQLSLMKSQLIFRVNSTLGQPRVKHIELQMNPKAFTTFRKPADDHVADNEIPIELWSAANAIHDRQLRQKFLKTAMKALKRKKRQD